MCPSGNFAENHVHQRAIVMVQILSILYKNSLMCPWDNFAENHVHQPAIVMVQISLILCKKTCVYSSSLRDERRPRNQYADLGTSGEQDGGALVRCYQGFYRERRREINKEYCSLFCVADSLP
jgi:hypothetical protein